MMSDNRASKQFVARTLHLLWISADTILVAMVTTTGVIYRR